MNLELDSVMINRVHRVEMLSVGIMIIKESCLYSFIIIFYESLIAMVIRIKSINLVL